MQLYKRRSTSNVVMNTRNRELVRTFSTILRTHGEIYLWHDLKSFWPLDIYPEIKILHKRVFLSNTNGIKN